MCFLLESLGIFFSNLIVGVPGAIFPGENSSFFYSRETTFIIKNYHACYNNGYLIVYLLKLTSFSIETIVSSQRRSSLLKTNESLLIKQNETVAEFCCSVFFKYFNEFLFDTNCFLLAALWVNCLTSSKLLPVDFLSWLFLKLMRLPNSKKVAL